MDVHAAITGWFSTALPWFARLRKSRLDSDGDLIRRRFGGIFGLTDEQVEIVREQAWEHLRSMRDEGREKRPEPQFYLVDALRHSDFRPELNVTKYQSEQALRDRAFVKAHRGN